MGSAGRLSRLIGASCGVERVEGAVTGTDVDGVTDDFQRRGEGIPVVCGVDAPALPPGGCIDRVDAEPSDDEDSLAGNGRRRCQGRAERRPPALAAVGGTECGKRPRVATGIDDVVDHDWAAGDWLTKAIAPALAAGGSIEADDVPGPGADHNDTRAQRRRPRWVPVDSGTPDLLSAGPINGYHVLVRRDIDGVSRRFHPVRPRLGKGDPPFIAGLGIKGDEARGSSHVDCLIAHGQREREAARGSILPTDVRSGRGVGRDATAAARRRPHRRRWLAGSDARRGEDEREDEREHRTWQGNERHRGQLLLAMADVGA